MRRPQRLIAMTVLIALSSALAGCGNFGSGFDPSDLLDWLGTKKKLPGERKPVSPEGAPGLEQGVPKDLNRGAQQDDAAAAAAQPSPPPTPTKRAARKGKGKPPAAASATDQAAAPAEVD